MNPMNRTNRVKGMLALLGVCIALAPVVSAAQTSTSDYREWTQWLFTNQSHDLGGGANITFTLVDPVGWSKTDGEAVLRIRLTARVTAGASPLSWGPELFFDNHYLSGNESLSNPSSMQVNCARYGSLSSAATQENIYNIEKECTLDRKLPTIGTHGIRARNRDAGTPTSLNWEFSIIYRYHITYTQPGSTGQFDRMENTANRTNTNTNAAWTTTNSSLAADLRNELRLITINGNVNGTLLRIGNNTDTATNPILPNGTLFSKLRGLGNLTGVIGTQSILGELPGFTEGETSVIVLFGVLLIYCVIRGWYWPAFGAFLAVINPFFEGNWFSFAIGWILIGFVFEIISINSRTRKEREAAKQQGEGKT